MEEFWLIEYENGKPRRRRAKEVICEECGKLFLDRVNGRKKFCCCECSGLNRRKRVVCCCAYCKIAFELPKNKLKISRSGLHFCCRICKDKGQSLQGGVKEIQPSHYGERLASYRERVFGNSKKICCVDCGECREYLLVVHHIDGNRNNDSDDNFEIVCMNCHARRHLHNINDKWVYWPRDLTPRGLIKDL